MSSYESCLTLFPFFSVNNLEFNYLCGTDSSSGTISYDKYFPPSKLSEISTSLNQQDFFAVHFNARSLSKNKDKIEDFFIGMKRIPDVVAISETKLNASSVSNKNFDNYKFFHNDSVTCANGVGRCVRETLKFRLRDDLLLHLQDCKDLWLEIESKETNFIIAVIYRHPKQKLSLFNDKLCETLSLLENNKVNYIVCGDTNINLLVKKTSNKKLC